MKVWLDDVRPAPLGWEHVTTAARAVELLASGKVRTISLDHDLGLSDARQTASGLHIIGKLVDAGSGYDVACWIEQAAHEGRLPPLEWSIHSANPVGVSRMRAAMLRAEAAWEENGKPPPVVMP